MVPKRLRITFCETKLQNISVAETNAKKQHFPKRKGDRDGRGRKLLGSKESHAAEEPENDSENHFRPSSSRIKVPKIEDGRIR